MEEPTPILPAMFVRPPCMPCAGHPEIYFSGPEKIHLAKRANVYFAPLCWFSPLACLVSHKHIFESKGKYIYKNSGHFAFSKSSAKRWGLDVQKHAEANRCAAYMRPVTDKTPESISLCSHKLLHETSPLQNKRIYFCLFSKTLT